MFSKSTLLAIMSVAQLVILIPLGTICFRFKRFNTIHKLLSILLICAGILSFIAYIMHGKKMNNMIISHFYTIIEYLLWSLIYMRLFDNRTIKKLIQISIFIVITFTIINMIFWQPLETYNSYSKSVESAFLVCFSIGWFYKVFVDQSIKRLETHPIFWINAAVLIYFAGSFLLFITNNFLMEIPLIEFFEAWTLHGIFIMIHYLFISIGLWLIKRKKELR
ncbi:hypothetical protein IMCC3317_01810 [Kordia antarctica]|uniref:Uncharacterized protein n=1 Tax=Kordia antarctica TaxID=1218801 RepID=A0A7L4ZDY5_9FLAO|nr:hypothetical protein [Kordia antarctica]QHI34837.1 hypothetical protein IMCC3317_01810 [Kordia antarctica]